MKNGYRWKCGIDEIVEEIFLYTDDKFLENFSTTADIFVYHNI